MTEDTARAALKWVLQNGITAFQAEDGHWYVRFAQDELSNGHLLLLFELLREIELEAVSAG